VSVPAVPDVLPPQETLSGDADTDVLDVNGLPQVGAVVTVGVASLVLPESV
jgi:hypothetical protein